MKKHTAGRTVTPQEQMIELWREIRAIRLQEVDLIERLIGKIPRTSQLRKEHDKLERSLKAGG